MTTGLAHRSRQDRATVGSTHAIAAPYVTDPATGHWGWRSGPCAALEHHFELLVEPTEACAQLAKIVAPFRTRQPKKDARTAYYQVRANGREDCPYNLYFNGEHLIGGSAARDLVGPLTWHLNRTTIGASVEKHVLLHASAAARAGMTVILPADMESGKSTTVAGLLSAGFDYITDEAVAIDPTTGRITPFPKRLSLDPGSWPLFPQCRPLVDDRPRQWHVDPGQFGARTVRASAPPPRFVVFPHYVRGAETTLTPVSRAEAVTEMARMAFHFSRHPRRNLTVIRQVSQQASLARLVIGSLDGAVEAVEGLISSQLLENL